MFGAADAFVFLTDEEKDLVHSIFHNEDVPYEVCGVGVDVPTTVDADRFKKKYNLDNYVIYVDVLMKVKIVQDFLIIYGI